MKKVLSLIFIASLAFSGLASADESAAEAPKETTTPTKVTAAPTIVAATK